MQNKLHKSIYREFVYCDPNDHLMKTDNKLTRPKYNCKHLCNGCNNNNNNNNNDPQKVITIQSDITGHYSGASAIGCNNVTQNINTSPNTSPGLELNNNPKNKPKDIVKEVPKQIIYDEDTFNQIELRGFITKELLKQSLERGSNLFHIAEDIFEGLCDKYHQFKEIYHTLTTEFDNTVECIIDTGKELAKKISHVIYELYLAVMNKKL